MSLPRRHEPVRAKCPDSGRPRVCGTEELLRQTVNPLKTNVPALVRRLLYNSRNQGDRMSTQALVVSGDAMVLNTIPRMLHENGADAAICREPKLALEMLARMRVDELFVDCDDLEGATDVLRSLKYVPSPAAVLRCAISSGRTSTQQAFEAGANFVIQKPVLRSTLGPVLNAAQGM